NGAVVELGGVERQKAVGVQGPHRAVVARRAPEIGGLRAAAAPRRNSVGRDSRDGLLAAQDTFELVRFGPAEALIHPVPECRIGVPGIAAEVLLPLISEGAVGRGLTPELGAEL